MKSLIYVLLIKSFILVGCYSENTEVKPEKISALDSSYVVINSPSDNLYASHFHPCEALGHVSTWIYFPDTSLYQPLVILEHPFGEDSDFLFNIYFKSTIHASFNDPNFSDMYALLEETLKFGFNKPPYIGDVIFYIGHNGKRFSNSWDPEYSALTSPKFIRDRTGLEVDVLTYEIVQNDCRSSGPFPSVRLVMKIDGNLVTSNSSDTLRIDGRMDFLISTSAF